MRTRTFLPRPLALGPWPLVLLLLTGCLGPINRPPEATRLDSPVVILPTHNCGNYFLLDATVNGKGPYTFLIDTGAETTVINERIVKDFGDDAHRVIFAFALGAEGGLEPVGYRVDIHSLSAGGMHLEGLAAGTLDLSPFENAIRTRIDGVLGYPAFGDTLLTFDYPDREVRLARGELPEPDGRLVLPLLARSIPEVEVTLGKRRVKATLDTGKRGGVSLQSSVHDELQYLPVQTGAGVAVGGLFLRQSARLASNMHLGQIQLISPVIDLSDGSNLIGSEVLRRFAVTFDPRHQRVQFDPAATGAAVPSSSERGTGIGFAPEAAGWRVAWVFAGSPAEEAGVQVGDLVVQIDGQSLHDFACEYHPPDAPPFNGRTSLHLDLFRQNRHVEIDVPLAVLAP